MVWTDTENECAKFKKLCFLETLGYEFSAFRSFVKDKGEVDP